MKHLARPARKNAIPTNDSVTEIKKAHAVQKAELEREIEIAALNHRLAQIKQSNDFKQAVSAREKLQKDFSEFEASLMGVQILERELRKEAVIECVGDSDLLEMKNLTIDAFVETHGLPPKRLPESRG